jgi:hypothetical protein
MITTLCHPIRILLRRVLAGATRREWAKRGTGDGASNTSCARGVEKPRPLAARAAKFLGGRKDPRDAEKTLRQPPGHDRSEQVEPGKSNKQG